MSAADPNAFLDAHCADCHSGATVSGGFDVANVKDLLPDDGRQHGYDRSAAAALEWKRTSTRAASSAPES